MINVVFALLVKLAKPVFWIALIMVTLLSLWPGAATPPTTLWSDKLNHAIAYFFLTIGLLVGWSGLAKNTLIAVACLFAWSGVLEIIQGSLLIGRTSSALDLLANGVGVLLALLAGLIFSFWYRHKFKS